MCGKVQLHTLDLLGLPLVKELMRTGHARRKSILIDFSKPSNETDSKSRASFAVKKPQAFGNLVISVIYINTESAWYYKYCLSLSETSRAKGSQSKISDSAIRIRDYGNTTNYEILKCVLYDRKKVDFQT